MTSNPCLPTVGFVLQLIAELHLAGVLGCMLFFVRNNPRIQSTGICAGLFPVPYIHVRGNREQVELLVCGRYDVGMWSVTWSWSVCGWYVVGKEGDVVGKN